MTIQQLTHSHRRPGRPRKVQAHYRTAIANVHERGHEYVCAAVQQSRTYPMFRVLVLRLIFKRVLDSGRFAQMIQYTAESRPCMGVVLTFSTFPGKKKKKFLSDFSFKKRTLH